MHLLHTHQLKQRKSGHSTTMNQILTPRNTARESELGALCVIISSEVGGYSRGLLESGGLIKDLMYWVSSTSLTILQAVE